VTQAITARRYALRRGFLLFLACLEPAFALDPTVSTLRYLHTSWTQEEGTSLPAILALAQTSDGYLWLGTPQGLIRFDGMRFVAWEAKTGEELPGNYVRSLLASSQGGLWISTERGIARMARGYIIRYPALDRWLGGFASAMLEDHDGNLWIAGAPVTGNTLAMLRQDGSVRIYSPSDGLPDRKALTLFEDSRADLWLGTHDGLCRWSPGAPAECSVVPNLTIAAIAEGPEGDLMIADGGSKRILRVSGGKLRPILGQLGNKSLDPRLMTRDRDGNIWVGTTGQGLVRLRGNGSERLTRHDGLSSDFINALLEDREGNLWVGTARGIDQYRDPKVLNISTSNGLSSDAVLAVSAARNGGTWVGTMGGGLDLVHGGQVSHYLMDSGLPSTTVTSLYEDAGRLWVGTSGGFAYQSGDRFVEVRAPDGQHISPVFAIAKERSGDLILAQATKGLFSLHDNVVKRLSIPGSEKKNIYQLLAARSGVLWVGYYQGGITAVAGDSYQFYAAAQGLAPGPVEAIYEDRGGTVWVGTGAGLSRFRRGRWTTWTAKQGLPDGGVQGIVEDDRGGLWLMTGSGILSLPLAALDNFPDGAPGNLAFKLYGLTEGLRLAGSANLANPRIAKSNDGRLWVCTQDGVAVIDPSRIRGNPVRPPVVIEQLVVDGRPMDTSSPSGMEFRGREVQISYTGLSLTVPERVRFRYRLEGLDQNWTDAGARRYVAYVNLPPAKYAFHVLACNNEGVWNTTGASLAFEVAPEFYQTRWFVPLCVVVAALLVWGAYWMRVRRLLSRFQLVAQERARMMRELHDSLLQGFSGVVYQLEAASRLYESNPEVSKRGLDHAIDQAEQSLQEARRAIMSMHLPEFENATLPEALSAAGNRAVKGSSTAFHLAVNGRIRELPYEVQANLYLVGREAIVNAVNHAGARKISVQLVYSAKCVSLRVQDDGVGFDLAAAKAKKDHRGVIGMHERAKHIGATLTIESASGQGARIELAAPLKT
jgi:ligand-binding sensor domain-containing protein/signal transduction histidine kinase